MVDRKRVNSVPYLESFPVDNRVRLYYSIFFFFPLSLNYPHARMRQSGSFQFSTKRGLEKGGGGGAGGGGGGGGGGISQGGGIFAIEIGKCGKWVLLQVLRATHTGCPRKKKKVLYF